MCQIREDDHLAGAPTADVTLIYYGDYECPHSQRVHHSIEAAQLHFGPQLRVAFRQYPLSKHPSAQLAAEAAEAAAAQGRFWEMHALLFESSDRLSLEKILQGAYELRLDLDRFQRDLSSGAFKERVALHRRLGQQDGVKKVPTVFINGELYDGERDLRPMVNAIEDAARKGPRTYADRDEHPLMPA